MLRYEFLEKWETLFMTDERVRNRCFYCGSVMSGHHTIWSPTVDHVLAKRTAKSLMHNTAKACLGCNGAKNGFTTDEFRDWYGEAFYCEKILGEPIPVDRENKPKKVCLQTQKTKFNKLKVVDTPEGFSDFYWQYYAVEKDRLLDLFSYRVSKRQEFIWRKNVRPV